MLSHCSTGGGGSRDETGSTAGRLSPAPAKHLQQAGLAPAEKHPRREAAGRPAYPTLPLLGWGMLLQPRHGFGVTQAGSHRTQAMGIGIHRPQLAEPFPVLQCSPQGGWPGVRT